MSVHSMHMVPSEARRGRCVLLDWSYRGLWISMWVLGLLNPGPLEKQPAILITEPSFQRQAFGFCSVLFCLRSIYVFYVYECTVASSNTPEEGIGSHVQFPLQLPPGPLGFLIVLSWNEFVLWNVMCLFAGWHSSPLKQKPLQDDFVYFSHSHYFWFPKMDHQVCAPKRKRV